MAAGFEIAAMTLKIQALAEANAAAVAKGLRDATEHVLGVSRSRVPIEEATLERSGSAHVDRENLRGYVYYDTPYAVVQHEDLTFAHDAGRQAKYLETAFTGEKDICRDLIVRAARWG